MAAGKDASQVMAALGQAAAHGAACVPGRPMSQPIDGVRFFHMQVSKTILPRRLVFAVDGTRVLEADAAGGRLLSVSTENAVVRFDDVTDTQGQNEGLEALKPLLLQACNRGAWIALDRSEKIPAATGGLSASRLADALGLSSGERTPGDMFHSYVQAAGADLLAAAHLQDELLYPLSGQDTDADHLAEVAGHMLPKLEALPGWSAQGAGLIFMAGGAGECLLICGVEGQWLFARARPGAQVRLTKAWNEVGQSC